MVILCYLITPIGKQKALRLQLSTAKIDIPAVGVGHFHAPLPMHAFAKETVLRPAPTLQGVGTDSKMLGSFAGREPLVVHTQSGAI